MEKRDGSKVVALVALVVAVVALSVGFATYTAQLNITNASAVMQGTDEFSANVKYRESSTAPISPLCYATGDNTKASVTEDTGYSAGTFDSPKHSWANIRVPLTMTTPSVTCEATVENISAYAAALSLITSDGGFLTATNGTGSNAATNVDTILNNTTVTVTIGSGAANTGTITYNTAANVTSGLTNTIQPNGTTTVTLVIAYGGSTPADGEVTINIPTIRFEYTSAAVSTGSGS